MSSEPAVKISARSNSERIRSVEFTATALWKTWTEFSLYLSLYVLGLSVCSDSIVLPLSLFYSLLSTRFKWDMDFSNFGPFLHIGREPNTQQISPSQLCGDNRQTGDLTTNFKLPSWQCFSHHISTIIICMNFFQLQQLSIQSITYPMIPHINMFGYRMKSWILTKMDSTLAINEQWIVILPKTKLLQEFLQP